ncbi:MAG: endopeptidase La, partial [Deltaproteobacteria bacterium]|nr:endopeptidase La [Deltaproteobacteria bacterium]
ADTIAAHLSLKHADKQGILELEGPAKRLERLYELMQAEIEILQVEKKIRTRVKKQMEKSQKEYYLNEQMQAIQKELGERDEFKSEILELEEKIESLELSDEAANRCRKELKKLKMMAPMSAEAVVVRNYLDWILSLPWKVYTRDELELKEAEQILENDHYGLTKAKERILEYLAVQALSDKLKGPILCFVGPPGVGKTSLAKSIARATGRKFIRLSLGGVRDEAEIRGHRRTYIGALPGKIVQSMRKAGSSNPVFLLDEVDKMSTDFRGDPASALLEVLDPEQNEGFNDHFLDLDYDLSKVMFITTANTLHAIPIPLQDRMEILQIPGYTEFDKLQIARRYLVTKQKEANGISEVDVEFNEGGIRRIINSYTREAGVRSLEREIASICRKVARQVVAEGKGIHLRITSSNVPKYLDVPRFKHGMADEKDEVGVTHGLAVTMTGGDLLTTEVTLMPGKGKLLITGSLGEVMQESAQAAMSYVRSRADAFGLPRDFYQSHDFHIHFPEGAIPKDGPSAGITMATSIVSVLAGIPVRRDVAMTGEITLRGRVLEIGGLKEKLLAAHRGGVHKVLIPEENKKDLKEVPRKVRQALTIVPVQHMDEVLQHALSDPRSLLQRGRSAAAPAAAAVAAPPGAEPPAAAQGEVGPPNGN